MNAKEQRPKIKPEQSGFDTIIEMLGWLILILLWGLTISKYSLLPATIPTHFNFYGKPDNFGDRESIFLLPVIGTLIFISMTISNFYPHKLNYKKIITQDNALEEYTKATRTMRYSKLILVVIFSLIVYKTFQTATGKSEGLGTWFLPVVIALVAVPIIFFKIKAFRQR